jgi:predicted AAA+ superfamily ATPase
MYKRVFSFPAGDDSVFLWGARQTGKSTLLKVLFPRAPYIDLLQSDEYERLVRRPALLREEFSAYAGSDPVIIDEVQKIPALLDEIHWLIVNKGVRFVLCGSSARRLRRMGANLLGGRALRTTLCPLVSAEVADLDIVRAANNGMLPRHYDVNDPWQRLRSYVGDYLQEEIRAEAVVRNVSAFARFLEVAAFSDGEIVNYQNIASECGVSAPTVKEYFSLLEDTMLGYLIPSYNAKAKRRVIQAPKFYYFDVGVANYLLKRRHCEPGSELFGKAFEHLVMQDIIAHEKYTGEERAVSYWRTASQYEVDCVLGKADVAVEIKSAAEIKDTHLKGLRAFKEDFPGARLIAVSMDKRRRRVGDVEVMPWKEFFGDLWKGKI